MKKKLINLFELNQNSNMKSIYPLIIIIASFIISWVIVYIGGGTKYAWVHFVYLPIVISAFFYKSVGGIVGGLVGGILMGPLMPMVVKENISQLFINYMTRGAFFVGFGTFLGIIFQMIFEYIARIKKGRDHSKTTGLPNQEKLREVMEEKLENNEKFSIITLGINNYYKILNIIGYNYGTDILKIVIEKINNYISKDMSIYNVYGNNFVILIEEDYKDIEDMVKRFNEYLSDSINFKDIPIHLKVHMGIIEDAETYNSSNEILQDSFIILADAINLDIPYQKYDKTLQRDRLKNMKILGEVKKAIREDQFELYYQPKVDLKSKKVIGAEGLIRWNHPEEGFVNPGDFIPQVESTHLITPLTYWVFNNSIKDLEEINSNGIDIKLAINISAKSFQDDDFIENIKHILENSDVNSNNLEFELTERDIMKRKEQTFKNIQEFRDIGINISIDDFGTGYSSLSHLHNLPANIIKIDRSFITNLDKLKSKEEIANAIIIMGHALGKEIVAEGIETEEELNLLKEMRCEYAQGYYLSKPLPFNDFMNFLEAQN